MKFLIWNITGLNKPFKQKEIVKMIRRLKLSIVCLVETRVKQENSLRIK
jgi:exonuclease III